MKRSMLNKWLVFLFVIGMLAGCRVKKAVVGLPPLPPETTVTPPPENGGNNAKEFRVLAVKSKLTKFNTLSIKSKGALSIGNNSNDVSMNIRIKNNEAIWVSVTAIAGLEVARALITPDSVKVINRLENEYTKKPFSYIYEFTNNKINFGTLQAVMTGNLIPEFLGESTEFTTRGAEAELKTFIGSIMYNVLVNEQNNLIQTSLSDAMSGQSLIATYGDFRLLSQQQIPHTILMKSQTKNKNINLDLRFTKVELDVPVDLPFRVPERFLIKN
ncbi:MAG: DUF4292 domain-containing protein [Daejeonella sp.]